jgi:hypothetical protein
MSNRRKLRPPATVTATARAYQCGHCHADTGRPHQDRDGIWRVSIHHDETCPVRTGTVSAAPAAIRAVSAAAASTGQTCLYLGHNDPKE